MSLTFSKWEGAGNDFVVVDRRAGGPALDAQAARHLCDRHFGVGGDGLVLVESGSEPDRLRMVIYNSDGSRAAMCGNALRCLAQLAYEEGRTRLGEWFVIETDSGPRRTWLSRPNWVMVDMGQPGPVVPVQVELEHSVSGWTTSMGNPHLVLETPELEQLDWRTWGRRLEHGPQGGAEGINVEFARVDGPEQLEVKVWERGAGPTLCCGTGACATLVALHTAGRCARRARVALPGGELEIEWKSDQNVIMTGPARRVFQGEWRSEL